MNVFNKFFLTVAMVVSFSVTSYAQFDKMIEAFNEEEVFVRNPYLGALLSETLTKDTISHGLVKVPDEVIQYSKALRQYKKYFVKDIYIGTFKVTDPELLNNVRALQLAARNSYVVGLEFGMTNFITDTNQYFSSGVFEGGIRKMTYEAEKKAFDLAVSSFTEDTKVVAYQDFHTHPYENNLGGLTSKYRLPESHGVTPSFVSNSVFMPLSFLLKLGDYPSFLKTAVGLKLSYLNINDFEFYITSGQPGYEDIVTTVQFSFEENASEKLLNTFYGRMSKKTSVAEEM